MHTEKLEFHEKFHAKFEKHIFGIQLILNELLYMITSSYVFNKHSHSDNIILEPAQKQHSPILL